MKLILHIGTHKTGTTALQQFLYANREALAVNGFHYATSGHGLPEANFVANALNVGKAASVQTFFQKHAVIASRHGADTIIASAENFYAMSVLDAMVRREVRSDAVMRDHMLVEKLRSLLPDALEAIQIVCYFRRPDRYAESLYSQHVKRGISFDGVFDDFLPIIKPALFYHANVEAWSDVFGKGNITVGLYESVRTDIVGDFVKKILKINFTGVLANGKRLANERVSRDVLEFKRSRNHGVRFSERDIERTILRLMDQATEALKLEPTYYQDFLSPVARAELLALLGPEMAALEASYGMPPFPKFDTKSAMANWRPYPGLSSQRRQELEGQYNLINRRLSFRFERFTLRSAGFLRRKVPSAGILLDVLKGFGAKHALRRAMRHLQLGSG